MFVITEEFSWSHAYFVGYDLDETFECEQLAQVNSLFYRNHFF